MDIGAEISKKIQMAITAKLKELDAYVDDELPDYIMIMVANKKTQAQMTEALSLFLSENTELFTSWLHNLLSALRKGKGDKGQSTRSENECNPKEKVTEEVAQRKSNADKSSKRRKSLEQHRSDTIKQSPSHKPQAEAIITIESNEMIELFDEELIAESSAAELMAPEVLMKESSKQALQKQPNLEQQQGIKASKADKNLKRKPNESSTFESLKPKKEKAPQKVNVEKTDRGRTKTNKQVSSKRTRNDIGGKPIREWDRGKGKDFNEVHLSTINQKRVKHKDESFYSDSESDDEGKKKGRVSSTVNQMVQDPEFVSESESDDDSKSKVSSRITYPKRTMRVPLDKQANKALFMRAVSAAEKSVKSSGAACLKSDAQIDDTELKMSASRNNKQLPKVGKREYADNDARRKLQIKKAISEAFQSQLVTSSRKGKTKLSKRLAQTENIHHSITRESAIQLDPKQSKRAKISDKVTRTNERDILEHYPQSDQRKFIIQKEQEQPDLPAVAFDSREALPQKPQENVRTGKRKSLPLSSATNASSVDKTSPNFIVTMDGVIRSKHNSQLSENERKAARIKKFKTEASADLAKLAPTNPKKTSSAMQELEKMKDKILQVERESSRLKEMQTKLAAVQSGTIVSSGNEQKSISVANVHYSTTEKQLSDYFSICGKVLRTTILRDITTGHPKGFAYLEFEDTAAVSSALALNNTQLNSRVIQVSVKHSPIPHPSYQPHRGYHRPYHGRSFRGFPSTFHQGRFTRFGTHKVITRNKTWINPTISGLSKS